LKRQIQDVDRCPLDKRRRALTTAFFLFSGPDHGPPPGVCVPKAAATREGKARLERMCGHLTRSRLLVTVPQRVSASLQIRTCCGTSVLCSPPKPTAL
jgi:hypothetical protein